VTLEQIESGEVEVAKFEDLRESMQTKLKAAGIDDLFTV